jgi:hypothetical protein
VINIARIPKDHDEGVIDVTPMQTRKHCKLHNCRPAEAALRMNLFCRSRLLRWGLINVVARSRRMSAFQGEADISQATRDVR